MKRLPDGPRASQIWQLIRWIVDPLEYLDQCYQRYGDFFTLRLSGFAPFVMVSHPQALQEIFTADPRQFVSGSSNEIVQPLVGRNSLLLLDGDRHRRERKLLMPSFHGESIRAYSKTICQIAERSAEQWEVGKPFTARSAMQEITLEVILNVVFGIGEGDRYQKLKPLIAAMLDLFSSPLRSSPLFFKFLQGDWGAWSPWQRLVQRQQQIRNLLQAEIGERRTLTELRGKDVLSLMMTARDENGEPMTDIELQDELLTLLVAGHETTATALAWAFYWTHRLPEVKDRLLRELDGLGDDPDPMAIAQLPYLTAVCQEALRVYPVVPIAFGRVTQSPMQMMGREFDAELMLVPCIYLIHRRPDLYAEPEQFKPERFLERQYSAYEFIPFGGGTRRCLGAALAMLEMKLVLATVLSQFQLELIDNQPVKAQRRGVTLAPSNGIPMVMIGRRKPVTSNQLPVTSSHSDLL